MSDDSDLILTTAKRAVYGERGENYGTPWENHGITAAFWVTYLRAKYAMVVPINAEDVCAMNRLQKESRAVHSPDVLDHFVDIAGYSENQAICAQHRRESA